MIGGITVFYRFVVFNYQKSRSINILCLRKVLLSRKEVSLFSFEQNLLHSTKKTRRVTFLPQKILLVSRQRGGITIFRRNFLCHSIGKLCRWTVLCFILCLVSRQRGCITISGRKFRAAVSKIFKGEPFFVS